MRWHRWPFLSGSSRCRRQTFYGTPELLYRSVGLCNVHVLPETITNLLDQEIIIACIYYSRIWYQSQFLNHGVRLYALHESTTENLKR